MKGYACRFAFCLVGILLLCVCAYAENIDFSAMSIEELVSMRDSINSEIYSRVLSDNIEIGPETPIIYEGTYFVGKDIKPGSYTISNLCPEGSMLIGVFTSNEDYEQFKTFPSGGRLMELSAYSTELTPAQQSLLHLNEGDILRINMGTASFVLTQPSFVP